MNFHIFHLPKTLFILLTIVYRNIMDYKINFGFDSDDEDLFYDETFGENGYNSEDDLIWNISFNDDEETISKYDDSELSKNLDGTIILCPTPLKFADIGIQCDLHYNSFKNVDIGIQCDLHYNSYKNVSCQTDNTNDEITNSQLADLQNQLLLSPTPPSSPAPSLTKSQHFFKHLPPIKDKITQMPKSSLEFKNNNLELKVHELSGCISNLENIVSSLHEKLKNRDDLLKKLRNELLEKEKVVAKEKSKLIENRKQLIINTKLCSNLQKQVLASTSKQPEKLITKPISTIKFMQPQFVKPTTSIIRPMKRPIAPNPNTSVPKFVKRGRKPKNNKEDISDAVYGEWIDWLNNNYNK